MLQPELPYERDILTTWWRMCKSCLADELLIQYTTQQRTYPVTLNVVKR